MIIRKSLFSLSLLMLCNISFAGPFTPSRFVIVAPKLRPKTDTTDARYLAQHGIWTNLQKGFKSAGDRFGWSIAFGGILEFVSWPGASLGMQGSIEVLADTRNDISFNPQGVNWEEGFLYNFSLGGFELAAGYLHRCVHNVDNLLTTNPDARDIQRTLIYGSLTARALIREAGIEGYDDSKLTLFLGADYYVVTEDYRYPEQLTKASPDIENLKLSISLGGIMDFLKIGSTSLYARFGTMGAFYSDTSTADLRAEFGIKVPGETMDMQLFFGGESLADDGGAIIPRGSRFFYAGLRFLGKNISM